MSPVVSSHQLSYKHGRRFHQRKPRILKEFIFFFIFFLSFWGTVTVQHNVEAQAKSHEEERVPDEERKEGS